MGVSMSAALVAVCSISAFVLGYLFYSRFLVQKVFQLNQNSLTPAHKYKDGVDFYPARKFVLFGHHYSSIAGAAPIVGPAVAVIWGWLPAVIWVVLGTILMGAVHDLGALVLSMKHEGESIGQLCEKLVGARVRNLFLIVTFFLVWLVIAVFALVIANLFISFPSSVLPVNFQIIIALLIGYFINKKGKSLLVPSVLALIALIAMMIVGTSMPFSLEPFFGENQMMVWIIFLMFYSYIASTLPVWALLQPRDYINSHQLLLGLSLMVIGLIITQPLIVAPAINPNPVGAPHWFPFLFITIACGAISGFHGLVSSGTTSKQVDKWSDVRMIGYGGMLGEGLLALLATLAATAGFLTSEQWHQHYSSWNAANGLNAKITAFVLGSSRFLEGVGIPYDIANTVVAVLIISFAATSLDTAARIQRYIVAELGVSWKIPVLKNRHVAGGVAIGSALLLMLLKGGGKGGLLLWPLFGATNQMLASLTLMMVAFYLFKKGKPSWPFLLPAVLMSIITFIGLFLNLSHYFHQTEWYLFTVGLVLLVIQTWVVAEVIRSLRMN